MAQTNTPKRRKPESANGQKEARQGNPFQPRDGAEPAPGLDSLVHLLRPGCICDTESRGHSIPQGRSLREIVVDASEGFIPLWAADSVLRWRFRERSMDYFADPAAAKAEIRNLFADALLAWGTAAPVTFTYDSDLWDFEIVMRSADQCNALGCVLAAAFFPDGGRHELELYPKMFTQVRKEQVDTMVHEIGHVFGLRHFFANVSETAWPSETFGRHEKFSIMNYGAFSELTAADKEDLTLLYEMVWSGELTHINGTPIRLVKPYSALAPVPDSAASGQVPSALRPAVTAAEATRSVTRSRPRVPQARSKASYLDGQ
jgi:hypothetical protein